MKAVDNLNKRVKKFSFIDMKLIGIASLLIGIIIAKLLPKAVESIPYWLFIILAVACLIRPLYIFFFKKE